ncbi:MAG: hypothetical protein KF757_01295 [Phycisphaeraceae bacterium]|nr:hypothetical protein [Phycisphaeraceae bacterium]MCW5761844.1 hypothetical protein [Phycisphaeraceae bacterium]
MLNRTVAIAVVVLPGWAWCAAQEATNTPAATQPAQGKWYLRQKVQFLHMSGDPSSEDRDIDKVVMNTSLTYGLRRDVSLSIDVPLVFSSEESASVTERDLALGDIALTLKYRPFQRDLNPVDSVRFAVLGGIEVPSGDGSASSDSFDPFAGAVFTAILGRHGFNQSLIYKVNTGGERYSVRRGDGRADALRYDSAYLFRLSPAEYSADTTAATYLTLELNGLYETNGDNEILAGPGLLYEARRFALEAAVGLPIVQDVDKRPRTDLMVTLGFRFLF